MRIIKLVTETTRRQKAQQAIQGKNSNIHTVVIMTAENPYGVKLTGAENKALNDAFKKDLEEWALRYFPIKGQYNSPEHSFMIYNMRLTDAKDLAKKYKQESFIFVKKEEDSISYEYWEDKYHKGDYIKKDNKSSIEDKTNDTNMFSQISRKFKFYIPFNLVEAVSAAKEYNNFIDSRSLGRCGKYANYTKEHDVYEDLYESLDETKTWKHCQKRRVYISQSGVFPIP